MTQTLPITKVRQNLPKLVDNAQKRLDNVIITVNGEPAARIISNEEYESLVETLEIMSDPELVKDLNEAEEDDKAGRLHSWEDVKKGLGWD